MEYDSKEKQIIIEKYLRQYAVDFAPSILSAIAAKVDAVPREIHNLCIKLRDFAITQTNHKIINQICLDAFLLHSKIDE
jgi:Holliday junction resolvasome RuvABC ATP-dependent DNA helicase subunit